MKASECVQLFTDSIQSMEFSRPEYLGGQPLPSPGDLPYPGIKPGSPQCMWILYRLSHQGSPGEGNGNQSSVLDWEILWTGEPDGIQSMGLQKSWIQLSD